ncbi:hypothetical protein TSUD_310420 [Trifolium subterraneum]|uniref:Beta-galactosidase n=1 Tax=Trifolium subterraneum TaxID=3900 RepID=A0A2Z6MM46_TRISU|nr:hypothetical protein TSUD_310420 [Trifolium subterraneum]
MTRTIVFILSVILVLLPAALGDHSEKGKRVAGFQNVTYDGKSLFINGRRELLFSGSVHYTRSTPDMWPDILEKARHGGLNVIQTYVFWNAHEPEKGKFNFEGNYDLVKFIKLIQKKGMYVTLRVGPFIQAEWNHGGLPYWLREVPGIVFRSDNEPYKKHMKAFVGKIIQMMKDEKLFAPQGGPIILAQIENEYNHIQLAYEENGYNYVQWAAKMAVAFDTGVPWIMCKQKDAPDPVVNTCNGRHCGDTFSGPNKPYKPSIWTENWTAQYRVFGDPISQRSAEDIAFSAPLDEYGLERQPKWSHLKDVHKAVLLCRKAILTGVPTVQRLNTFHEIRVFENPKANICAAFITNNHTTEAATINFRGSNYFLPAHSISVLPDCKTVVYNTQSVVSQHNARNFVRSAVANNFKWEVFSESIPSTNELKSNQKFPAELYILLKDTTDYGWYTTSFELGPEDLPKKSGASPVLRIMSLGHSLSAFVNGQYIGTDHGTHDDKTFEFEQPASFKVGTNYVSILATTVGLPDSGAYMEHRYAGPKSISVLGLNTGTIDLTKNDWGHQVGLKGEQLKIFSEEGSKKVEWTGSVGQAPALSWFKTRFTTPEGRGPVAIRMTGMGKGMIWVNGQSIGRHWMTFLSPLGQPTQSEYHIPRSYLNNGKDNLLVILEEEKACPEKIEILNVDRDTICSYIAENEPANVNSWVSKRGKFLSVVKGVTGPQAFLKCPSGKKIVAVEFASFGNPSGYCGKFSLGNCNAASTKSIVEKECLGKEECMVAVSSSNFNGNGCPDLVKMLAIQAKCSY